MFVSLSLDFNLHGNVPHLVTLGLRMSDVHAQGVWKILTNHLR